MNQAELFNTPGLGRALRDQALERVRLHSGSWIEKALLAMSVLQGEYTGEDVRAFLDPVVGRPHHSNAYGALIAGAIRRGILTPTGRYKAMKRPSSHYRKNPVYLAHGG